MVRPYRNALFTRRTYARSRTVKLLSALGHMIAPLLRLIDWFIPERLRHSKSDLGRARTFVFTHLVGPTSGASYLAAAWWARSHPGDKVLMILPDEGHRYQKTVYNAEWLSAHSIDMTSGPDEPELVSHPLDAPQKWSRLLWGRRHYEEVAGKGKP